MYLTKLGVKQGDDYLQHQNIRSLFPGDQKVLFQRSDSDLFILSDEKPESDNLSVKEIDMSAYKQGDKYTFSLRLNPVKRDIKSKKRVALDADQVKGWIRQQLSAVGVDANFQYIREGVRRSMRHGKKISFASVLCFGSLTIKDSAAFQGALIRGVGHGKGFGFGMINVFL